MCFKVTVSSKSFVIFLPDTLIASVFIDHTLCNVCSSVYFVIFVFSTFLIFNTSLTIHECIIYLIMIYLIFQDMIMLR